MSDLRERLGTVLREWGITALTSVPPHQPECRHNDTFGECGCAHRLLNDLVQAAAIAAPPERNPIP